MALQSGIEAGLVPSFRLHNLVLPTLVAAGVAAVQNNLAAAAKALEAKFYTSKPGDTLWKIAETEYGPGHGGKYHLIFEANKALLSNPGKLSPGQVLRIPPLSG